MKYQPMMKLMLLVVRTSWVIGTPTVCIFVGAEELMCFTKILKRQPSGSSLTFNSVQGNHINNMSVNGISLGGASTHRGLLCVRLNIKIAGADSSSLIVGPLLRGRCCYT